QLTGRTAYEYANAYTKKEGADIITNPDLVVTNVSIAILSSMAFWKWKKIDTIVNGKTDTKPVCIKVGKDVDGNHNLKQNVFTTSTSITFQVNKCNLTKTEEVTSNEETIIRLVRRWQTEISTIGEFTIDGTDIKGYILEEKGPDTTQSGKQSSRLPR
ncbi:hypothetical protein, partial [Flavobacterium columnare]